MRRCRVARPKAELGISFDYLAGEREERRRDLEAELLRGLEIDDEFDFGRLDDRQLLGLFALENEPGVSADQTIDTGEARSVAHQPAGFGPLTLWIGCRQTVALSQGGDLAAAAL